MSDGPVELLIDEAALRRRIAELAEEVAAMLPPEFTIVGLLKGAFILVADLARALHAVGRAPEVTFLQLSSYGSGTVSGGRVEITGELPAGLAGRAVLLVDDILDSGRTLAFARDLLQGAGAAPVRSLVLLDKPSGRALPFEADLVGFKVPDVFVVGYGIDHAERWRHLPYIARLVG